MGFGQSKPVIGETVKSLRFKLLRDTQSNNRFMNILFQRMIHELTPEDFLKLGNPKKCSEYIFLMGNSFNKTNSGNININSQN